MDDAIALAARIRAGDLSPAEAAAQAAAACATADAGLRGLDVLVLNALWWRSHPTHLSIEEAIEVAQSLGARRTYLTHLTHETGHADLAGRLPDGIFPAHDGLAVEVR